MMHLPEEFIEETRLVMGDDRFNCFLEAFNEEAPTSIRLNPLKIAHGDRNSVQFDKVPWCEEGYYLEGRPQFTFDPLFHAGCYYVQEAASMFVSHILRTLTSSLSHPLTVLDLCAAPGGKSTAAIAVLPEGSTIVSNEPNPTRAQILLENITKWGHEGCTVTNSYPRDFRKAKLKFDVILCDVPCSGEGMFRKDPQTVSEWSRQNVEKCWRLQREIVAEAWECLHPGGILIYSTCTFNTKENEENVRWMLAEYPDAELLEIPTLLEWHITGSLLNGFDAPVYRFIPGITRSEGLFICVLRKRRLKIRNEKLEMRNDDYLASPKTAYRSNHHSSLKVLSPLTSSPSPLTVDLSYRDALRYLRGEALVLPADTPRGMVTVTYGGIPLGPMKNIGSRANNLYPKPWRIKTTHLPEKPPAILEQIAES